MTRKWCPSEWLDEVAPVMVDDPSQTLRLADGRWCMVDDDWDADPAQGLRMPLEPEQVVAWCYYEPRGTVRVLKHEEGTYSLKSAGLTGAATHWVRAGDYDESLSDTLDELVREHVEPGEEVDVVAYFWSDDIPHRFDVVDGKGVFVPVDTSGAIA